MKKCILLLGLIITLAGCSSTSVKPADTDEKTAYETINAAVVGDRVLVVAAELGYMPKVMAVRASQWPKAKEYPAELVGCPVKVTVKDKTIIPAMIDKYSLDTVLVEKNSNFCLLMKNADPMKIVPIIKDKNVKIESFDFSESMEEGIMAVAKYFGKEKEGKKLVENYSKDLSKAEKMISTVKPGKKVVVLNGFKKADTGRLFISAESKGFYTDKFFLTPFGCINESDKMNVDGNEVVKGYFPVMDLSVLAETNPDVIILYGATGDLVKAISKTVSKNPELKNVPAIKNNKIITDLPWYVDSDIFDYPEILTKWINTFNSL